MDGPAIALVSGEAGIGKTRLVRELVAGLPADVTVLSAHAQPGSLGRPFDVLAQLVDDGTADLGAQVTAMVAAAVRRGRVLLVVEDLHWSDADSAHVIEQLAQQPWPNLVIVGTFRPGDLSRKAPGGELLSRLERQHSVEQVRLDRLDRTEVGALLTAIGQAEPSSAAVDTLYRRSGGIPFVVEELLRCCGVDACTDDLMSAQLPWSLDEAIRQQLSGLPAQQRRVVDVLAVYGDPAPFEVLAAVTELDDQPLLDALRELVTLEIVDEVSDDTFWFSHALMADSVQQQLLGRERRRLHERSLAVLRSMPNADHASLARHALGAGHFDQVPGIAREGVRQYLARGASFQALRLAGAALAEAPDDPELLGVATDAAWRLQYSREALAYARHWTAVALTDIDRVESRRFVARIAHEMGLRAASDDALADLVAVSVTLPAGLARGRSYGAIAQIHMIADRGAQAIEWADRAIEEARRTGDEWLIAQASVERSSAHLHDTDLEAAERALLDAREAARNVGDAILECRALNNLLALVGAHSDIGAWARDELAVAARSCGFDKLGSAMLALWEAEAAYGRGDMRAVRHALAEARQFWGPSTQEYSYHMSQTADLLLEEGLVAEAMAALAEMRANRDSGCHFGERGDERLQLLAAALTGDRSLAERAFGELLAVEPPSNSASTLWLLVDLVQSALAAGIDAGRVRAELLTGWLGDHRSAVAVRVHAEGLLLLAEGHAPQAAAALQSVLDQPDARLYVPVRATMRVALASALLSSGERAAALANARLAVGELATWPGWRRDRAEALVRRLEGAGARSDGELTARELEVAALLAEGLTNGQLAERLYISPKTAAVHVSNILMKLGLSGRAEVAAWAVRHGAVLEPS